MKEKIFVIDDEQPITLLLKNLFSGQGYDVDIAHDIEEAKGKMDYNNFDLMISDINLGTNTGMDLLQEVKKRNLTSPVIFITGNPNIDTASEAVRLGAYDYLLKPIENETLLRTVKKALQHKVLIDENIKYRSNLDAMFKSTKDAIIMVDNDLVILELNKAAEEICGIPSNAEGEKCESFLENCSEKYLSALKETITTGLPAEANRFECDNRSGPRRVVSIVTYPLFDYQEKSYGCVLLARDETKLVDLESDLHERQQLQNIIGKSEKMQNIYTLIETLTEIQTTVLITGESGTGKGLVADALHYYKRSVKKPFVVVNCTTLSDNLLESELFGHVKGAFTGAVSNRIGRFQRADGGTIFLDEIGDISITMQLRLLKVLQDQEFERVGDSTPVKVNVRVIAATNQDLRKKVKQGKFREDLYHRLKVVELTIPSLRERREDIPLLVDYFLEKFNKTFNKNIKSISADVQKIFMEYKWPGNIRELRHAMESAFVLCKNKSIITIDNLPSEFQNQITSDTRPLKKSKPYDQHSIIQALKETDWNKAKAARLLGISRGTIYAKFKEYGITENPTK
ncbi:MAG: response regulator [Candidatus Scalindua sp.]|nr:response regulator [Candidatus Scalindua sp.]